MNIYDVYSLNHFPRYFGYPSQILIKDLDDLQKHMFVHAGRDPLYISHNSHNKEYVVYSQMFFDFDAHTRSTEDMQKAQKDCQTFVDYHKDKTDILINFTGGGFHVLLKFQPKVVLMKSIAPKIRGYQKNIKDLLNLQTLDLKVAEPGRLFRIPLSPYVYNHNGTNVSTNRYDIPIDENILFNYTIDELIYLSEKKDYTVNNQNGLKLSVDCLEPYSMKDEEYNEITAQKDDIDFYAFTEEYFRHQIETIFNDEYLITAMLSKHPHHTQNFIACLKVKNYGLSLNSAVSFFARLSEIAKWDNRDLSIQKYQIETIYEGDYKMTKGVV